MTTREMIDLIRHGTSPIGRKALLEMAERLELLELTLDGTQSLLWATERKLEARNRRYRRTVRLRSKA